MANSSKLVTGINYGQPGRLVYTPLEGLESGIGKLHHSRLSSQSPNFNVIGTTAELYPPSKDLTPESLLRPSHERQVHEEWLRASHPEAFPGLGTISELLSAELSSAVRLASAPSTRQLLDIGQITDVTSRTLQRLPMPAIAMAAGEAGEKLRIARIDQSKWAWDASEQTASEEPVAAEDVQLDLAIVDPDSWQDECLWTNDGLPFTQIKFATHKVPHEPIRWILAQKSTSTSILNPTYHKIPLGDINVEALDFHLPSKIDPQHELTITHSQTGGRAHCDVAFNPPTTGSPPQVAIMDECGYWTVWAIVGRTKADNRIEKRAILRKHGHIDEGLLAHISFNTIHPSRPHGTLFVGMIGGSDFQASFVAPESMTRAPYVLAWSPEKFEVIDLEDGAILQPFEVPRQRSSKPSVILDARLSPVTQTHFFILTSSSLLWMEMPSHGLSSKPTLILECPHLPAMKDLRMSVSHSSEDGESVMVYLYSPGGTHFVVNWLQMAEEIGLPSWHRQVLPIVQNSAEETDYTSNKLDMMLFHSSKLSALDDEPQASLGEAYWKKKVLFFQGLLLSEDLGLRYCIATTSQDPGLEVSLPTHRLQWTPKHKKRSWKKQHNKFLRHIKDAFVLPDGMEPEDANVKPWHKTIAQDKTHEDNDTQEGDVKGEGHVVLNVGRALNAVKERLEGDEGGNGPVLPALAIERLESMLETGIAEASVPLFTWQDVVSLSHDTGRWKPAAEVTEKLHQLRIQVEDDVTMPELRLRSAEESTEERITAELVHKELTSLQGRHRGGPGVEGEQQSRISIGKLASDCYLSTQGFVIQDVPLFGRVDPLMEEEESQEPQSFPASQSMRSSQSPGRIRSSSPASVVPEEKLQAQFRRLQLLAPSLKPGTLAGKKPPKVLSYWPAERGAEIGEYVSSVATESDMKFDDLRQRRQRSEARKKAQAEKLLKRPAFTRQGFPEEDRAEKRPARMQTQVDMFRSSPQPAVPMSSQSQGQFGSLVTMSQPMPGAFGDRKKAKKMVKKKKSGFR